MTEAQGDRVIALLEQIASALAVPDAPVGCPHPDEHRIDLSTFGDRNHWVCRLCRFDNTEALEARYMESRASGEALTGESDAETNL